MNGVPSFAQVRAQVAAVRDKFPEARVIGIRVPELGWDAPTLRVGGEELPVASCGSVLEVRARLVEQTKDGPPLVILTDVSPNALGVDLLARFARRQLFSVEPWQLVKERFRARYIDPRLVERHPWVAIALLDAEPDEGYPPAPSGFLEAETAWRHLFEVLAGIPRGERDPDALLAWALDGKPMEKLGALPEDVRTGLAKAVGESSGQTARAIFESAGRLGLRSFSVGLVAGVLFHPDSKGDERAAKARGRLEALLGLGDLDADLARGWTGAAERVLLRRLAQAADPQRALGRLLADADALLRDLGAEDLAWRSGMLRSSLEQRLGLLAQEVVRFVEGTETEVPSSLREAAEAVLGHLLSIFDPTRTSGIDMALRLAGWIGSRRSAGAKKPGSFRDAALAYRAEGGFADWARTRVWDGDTSQPLAEAYARLAQKADELRESENRQFATLLVGWLESGSHDESIQGVEVVLDHRIVPLAKAHPLLLLVIDAMNAPVFRELEGDLLRRGWVELLPAGISLRPAVIAAIPTVTEVSRTSLLCGSLSSGNSPQEKDGFSKHAGLVSVSEPMAPPVLFHKADLRQAGVAGVAPKVLDTIGNLHQRIVGVVINAVDDHLAKGDQIRVRWTADAIRPLEELLEVSRASGRVVVLVSDHGHILERETEMRGGEGSERWRPAAGAPAGDEIVLTGARVLVDGNRLLAPWSERVRFGMKKNGYHGGATPQEVVIPLGVFAMPDTASRLAGWREVPPEIPAWWEWRVQAMPAPEPAKKAPKAPSRAVRKGETGDLFAQPEPQPVAAAWIDRLFETELFEAQRKQAARTALPDERIRAILEALDQRGGKLTSAALAENLGIPPFRLGGIVSALRRILNVEGYDVLSVDEMSETVALNRDLLDAQFGLTGRKK